LVYQGSRDGFAALDFHTKADGIANTLTIIKTNRSNIFGGYTAAAWATYPAPGIFHSDNTSFLYSLVNEKNLAPYKMIIPSKNANYAICNRADYGPLFGEGYDLWVGDSSNIKNSGFNQNSYPFNMSLGYGYFDDINNWYNFRVSEIEIYQIS
jgi:hypothetical protein